MRHPSLASFLAMFTVTATLAGFNSVNAQTETNRQNGVYADELFVEPPTLQNLGFEWFIRGDANRNAVVSVAYRKGGEGHWVESLPLLRLGGERIYAGVYFDVEVPPMFAGSVLDLEPDTAYEVRFRMDDPDGVLGQSERLLSVKTRPEPEPYAAGNVYHVYPHDYEGEKVEPSFEGLLCAYHYSCTGTDWSTTGRPRVRPGDTILVHAGLYKYNRYIYTTTNENRLFPTGRNLSLHCGWHRKINRSSSKLPVTVR